MKDNATRRVSEYIEEKGLNIMNLSRKTGVPYGILQRSVVRRERDLRADEFLKICEFLQIDPLSMYCSDPKKVS